MVKEISNLPMKSAASDLPEAGSKPSSGYSVLNTNVKQPQENVEAQRQIAAAYGSHDAAKEAVNMNRKNSEGNEKETEGEDDNPEEEDLSESEEEEFEDE